MNKEIIEISYPISVIPSEQQHYIVGKTCKAIKSTTKNGEMASIDFYEIELNDGTFEEVRASEVVARYRKIQKKDEMSASEGCGFKLSDNDQIDRNRWGRLKGAHKPAWIASEIYN